MKNIPLLKWFRNVSLTKKLYFVVGIMAALIGIELFALNFTIHTLSATRALVGAEGLWSKAQKDATSSLQKYGYTHNEMDYQHYLNMLKVPLGDHKARMALSETTPNKKAAFEGFAEGRIHPDDIDGVINLLTRFHSNAYITRAVIYWTRGDSMILVLQTAATKLHEQILSGTASSAEINKTSEEIQDSNNQITGLEDNFSFALGDGSRWMEHLILELLFLIALTVELSGLFMSISVSRAITKGITEIVKIAHKVATGNFTSRARVFSKDEIGFLAVSFNQMVGNLERKTQEEKQAENALRSQKELYETLLKAQSEMGEGVIISQNGEIIYVNEATCKIYGYSMEEIMRLPSSIHLISQEEQYISNKKPDEQTGETRIFRKDGKAVDIEYTTRHLRSPGNIQSITMFRDVTEKKEVDEQLQKAKENAVRADLAKQVGEKFLATMSHEIRTPMNSIIGFTDILINTPLSEEQKKFLRAIKMSGDNLLVIINDILDISRIKAGKMRIEQKGFVLSQILSVCVEQMLPKAMEKGIDLSTIVDNTIPAVVVGDPNRLTQILLNFLSNAVKFTHKGAISMAVHKLAEEEDNVMLEFSVKDTGIGVSEDKLNEIFDAFTQASDSTARLYGGTGLGLAIVKQLAELQGGSVSVESKVGEGSCFYFRISYKKAKGNMPLKHNDTGNIGNEEIVSGLKVLVVEDNSMNQLLAQKVLEDWGWTVEIASGGMIAIEKIKQNDYDIVLMDIQMPEMDGYETTAFIREKLPVPKCYVPIIATTAHVMQAEEDKCFEAGMDAYISKPFSIKLLYSKILAVLKNRSATSGILFHN
ncbi:MAG TPA: ATP-binding protein [Bacteroidia bacterium]|nr:ATP-binding protein [Bacteroidia bacterium]